AALHVADLERPGEVLLKERNVLEIELFLKGLGAGGDDDTLTREERRDQVGERLAGARARFDDQVAPIGDGFFDRLRHLDLTGAEIRMRWLVRRSSVAAKTSVILARSAVRKRRGIRRTGRSSKSGS